MKILNKIIETILVALIAVMVLACIWQVATRFILGDPSKYTEEFIRFSLIWLTMIGAPYAYGKNKHLSINVLTDTFNEKEKKLNKVFIELVVLFLSVSILIIGGSKVTANAAGQISAAMLLPMQVYYGCVPLSGILMVIYSLDHLIHLFKKEEN